MRRIVTLVAVLGALAGPAGAQEAPKDVSGMTCGEFLALDADGQVAAMLALRAGDDGGEITAKEEAEAATAVTNATQAGAIGGADGARATVPDMAVTPEARQRSAGMRTSCLGMEDMPAVDAMIAAHADYEPVFETPKPGN